MEALKMKTTHVSLEFKKNHAIFGMERSNEYENKYIISDDQTSTKKYVGTDRIEDWFIYIVPCFPIHVQTVKTYNWIITGNSGIKSCPNGFQDIPDFKNIDNKTVTTCWSALWQARNNLKFYFFAAPIRNMLVPQVGQTPLLAGLPFFIVMALAFFISFFKRHFTQ